MNKIVGIYHREFHTENKEWNSLNSSKSKKIQIVKITTRLSPIQLCDAVSTVTYIARFISFYWIYQANAWYFIIGIIVSKINGSP